MSIFAFDRAIVRTPGESAVDGLRAGGGRAPDPAALRAEHRTYVEALESLGVAVEILEPLEQYPDSMFVEDPALVFPEGAILLRPGAPSRRGEAAALEPALRERFGQVLVLDEGHVDGGDVLVTPRFVFIGCSARTDLQGARRLSSLLAGLGREARIVATPPTTLHLKSDCALIGEETILATPALAESGAFEGFELVRTPAGEERSANTLRVGDTVLLGNSAPRTAELMLSRNLSVRALPIFEIEKLDAGLSCLSLRWNSRKI